MLLNNDINTRVRRTKAHSSKMPGIIKTHCRIQQYFDSFENIEQCINPLENNTAFSKNTFYLISFYLKQYESFKANHLFGCLFFSLRNACTENNIAG